MNRIYKLEMFIEVDDKNLEKLIAAAKKIVRASNPDIPEGELISSPGDAIVTIIEDLMYRGRHPLHCVESANDISGVPVPDDWNDPDRPVIDLEEYCSRFLVEHPAIMDEDDFPTGEYEGYPTGSPKLKRVGRHRKAGVALLKSPY